jgi:hypothetical protein
MRETFDERRGRRERKLEGTDLGSHVEQTVKLFNFQSPIRNGESKQARREREADSRDQEDS